MRRLFSLPLGGIKGGLRLTRFIINALISRATRPERKFGFGIESVGRKLGRLILRKTGRAWEGIFINIGCRVGTLRRLVLAKTRLFFIGMVGLCAHNVVALDPTGF